MIDVELGPNILDNPTATYELGISGPTASVVVEGDEDDTYEDVVRGMCRALALVGLRGEMRLFYDGMADEEEKREIFATIDRLKGTLSVTDVDAARAIAEERQQAENIEAGFKKMASVIQQEGLRRGLNKEERGKLTLGEALEPPGED